MLITSGEKAKSPPSQILTKMTEIVYKTYFQRNMTSTNRKNAKSQEPAESGVSISFRFSETIIAMAVSSCVSISATAAVSNNFHQSQINNCTLGQPHSTSVQSVPEPSPGKNK